MKSFINWIKPSFEGSDGKASSRKLSAFVVLNVYVVSRILYSLKASDPIYQFYALALDAAFTLLLFGIVTAANIIAFKGSATPAKAEEVY